ncbi:hypothetical protein Loa_00740 [Legionella oakridgensis ATCC 33761 = DSM 21215]|uniref:Uncharacterized protein n=1 Tax=Legionella oakridgensis ATCC 33761 = DSM 21215 TaxID=1268635 RepID=W0BD36_9GAMM|nr:hypothetical protein Loa_00740 [Legionella oakridgensis ATCC 33761 = DSM 21215]
MNLYAAAIEVISVKEQVAQTTSPYFMSVFLAVQILCLMIGIVFLFIAFYILRSRKKEQRRIQDQFLFYLILGLFFIFSLFTRIFWLIPQKMLWGINAFPNIDLELAAEKSIYTQSSIDYTANVRDSSLGVTCTIESLSLFSTNRSSYPETNLAMAALNKTSVTANAGQLRKPTEKGTNGN